MIIKLKRAGTFLHPFDDEGRAAFNQLAIGQEIEVEIADKENPKTVKQRAALHVWLEDLAILLNDAGLERVAIMAELAKHGIELPWTKDSSKELLYKPVLEAMTGKTSTEDMNTVEPSEVCKVIGRRLAEKYGVTVPPWPSRFNE